MVCDPLPGTGVDAYVGPLLLLGAVCLVTGTMLVLLAQRRRGWVVAAAIVLLVGGLGSVIGLGTGSPAQAATSGCSSSAASDDRLTVVQTSSMVGLAPGVAPAPITGRLGNHSAESTHVDVVDVALRSVTVRPGSAAGACDISDYRVVAPRMRVGRTLRPGGSVPFAGAAIAFNDKSTNQDACQGATVQLLYTANPSGPAPSVDTRQ